MISEVRCRGWKHLHGSVFRQRVSVLDRDFVAGLQAIKNSDPSAGADFGFIIGGNR